MIFDASNLEPFISSNNRIMESKIKIEESLITTSFLMSQLHPFRYFWKMQLIFWSANAVFVGFAGCVRKTDVSFSSQIIWSETSLVLRMDLSNGKIFYLLIIPEIIWLSQRQVFSTHADSDPMIIFPAF